jgi:hypothetical protein
MKILALLMPLLWSATVLAEPASDSCRLKVVSTSLVEGGITVTTLRYKSMDLTACTALCKSESRLKNEIEAGHLVLSCRLKHESTDGTETRLRHRFRLRPRSDCPGSTSI